MFTSPNNEQQRFQDIFPKEELFLRMISRASERQISNQDRFSIRSRSASQRSSNNLQSQKRDREIIADLDLDDHLLLCASRKEYFDEHAKTKFVECHKRLDITMQESRKIFILLFSGAYFKKHERPGYYDVLVSSRSLYPDKFFSSIEKDIYRTFSSSPDQASKLRRILEAYAIRSPNTVYCQGLNYIVAYFMMNGYSEQDCFWVLVALIQDILPPDFYVDMSSVICLNAVFDDLVKVYLPAFEKFSANSGVETSYFVVQWLVCIYTKGFSNGLTGFILECLVLEQEIALLKSALAILSIVLPRIKVPCDLGEFLMHLQEEVFSISLQEFQRYYDQCYINKYYLSLLLQSYHGEYLRVHPREQTVDEALSSRKSCSLPLCNPDYPVCLHVTEINRMFRGITQVETIKLSAGLDSFMDHEYMDVDHTNLKRVRGNSQMSVKVEKNLVQLKDVPVGRHRHVCVRNNSQKLHVTLKPKKEDSSTSFPEFVDSKGQQIKLQDLVLRIIGDLQSEGLVHTVSSEEDNLDNKKQQQGNREKNSEDSRKKSSDSFKQTELRKTNMLRLEELSGVFEVLDDTYFSQQQKDQQKQGQQNKEGQKQKQKKQEAQGLMLETASERNRGDSQQKQNVKVPRLIKKGLKEFKELFMKMF